MGGIPRPIKTPFKTPRLGAAAEFGAPMSRRPNSNLYVAEADSIIRHQVPHGDGTVRVEPKGIEIDLAKNMEGLYQKARDEGIDPEEYMDEWGEFSPTPSMQHTPAYMMQPYDTKGRHGVEHQDIQGRGHASIAKTNGEEILRQAWGDEMAGQIIDNFVRRKNQSGLLAIDRDGPEANLYNPLYVIKGERPPTEGTRAFWDRLNRMAYLPVGSTDFEDFHELTHANLEGRQAGPPQTGLPTWDDIKANLRADSSGMPMIGGDAESPLLWFMQRWSDPASGRAELVADWALANRARSSIMGNPDRSPTSIINNLKNAVSGRFIDDPTMQLGPQGGQEIWWQPAIEAAMERYWNTAPLSKRNKQDLMEMLLDSGSTQDGKTSTPYV